jgi:hypothetical protein
MDENTPPQLNIARLERGLFLDDDAPSPGLELGDPRLDAITDAAFKSHYGEAAALAQQVWDEGIRDVRLVGYLVYGSFAERSAVGLPFVFEQLGIMLTERWDLIGPAKKDKPADGALNWLFQTLLRQLTSHEKLKDEVYASWLSEDGTQGLATAAEAATRLIGPIEERFPQGKSLDKLRSLAGTISEIAKALQAEAAAAARARARAASEAEAEAEAEAVAASEVLTSDESAAAPRGAAAPAPSNGSVFVEGGPAMALLMRKLALFHTLMDRGDTRKAAVVAADVEQLVKTFDPIVFLPKLFVPFFRALSRNMEELDPALASVQEPFNRALVTLYQADLDAFAEP